MSKADELWTELTDNEKKMLRALAKKKHGVLLQDEQMLLKMREAPEAELDQFRSTIKMLRANPVIAQVMLAAAKDGEESAVIKLPPSAAELFKSQVATEPPTLPAEAPPPAPGSATGAEAKPPAAPDAEAIGKAGAAAIMKDPTVMKLTKAVDELLSDSAKGEGPMADLKKAQSIASTLSVAAIAEFVRDIAIDVGVMRLQMAAIYGATDVSNLTGTLSDPQVRAWVAKQAKELEEEIRGRKAE